MGYSETFVAFLFRKTGRLFGIVILEIVILAADNRETGSNPVRSRHCIEGVFDIAYKKYYKAYSYANHSAYGWNIRLCI